MKFRPLHDRVIVKRVEEEEKTSGGIIIPDAANKRGRLSPLVREKSLKMARSVH
jgi:chaperonin GroES